LIKIENHSCVIINLIDVYKMQEKYIGEFMMNNNVLNGYVIHVSDNYEQDAQGLI